MTTRSKSCAVSFEEATRLLAFKSERNVVEKAREIVRKM